MTARDALSLDSKWKGTAEKLKEVPAGMHLLEVMPLLFEAPGRALRVTEGESELGVIDSDSMLEAMSRMISARYDCSIIEFECAPADFSASRIAHAIEDTDAHLVDMLSVPGVDDTLSVTLRVRCEDPSAAVQSLERYGYNVTSTYSHDNIMPTAAIERLMALQALINV